MRKPTSIAEAQTDKKNRRKVEPPVVESPVVDEQLAADAFHGGDHDNGNVTAIALHLYPGQC